MKAYDAGAGDAGFTPSDSDAGKDVAVNSPYRPMFAAVTPTAPQVPRAPSGGETQT